MGGKNLPSLDCKTVGVFLRISKEICKTWRKNLTRAKRESLTRRACESYFWRHSPVSLSFFSLVPDLLFDCSHVLEDAKIRSVLQSIPSPVKSTTPAEFLFLRLPYYLLGL